MTGYLGALCIIKPHTFVLEMGIITALLANLLAGSSIIIAKVLSKNDSTLVLMGYNNIGVFMAAALFNFNGWHVIGWKDGALLSLMALLGLAAQYCSLTALKQSRPSFLAPFDYTRLLFSFLIGFTIFQEVPDLYTILGSFMIILATYIITYREENHIKALKQKIP